MLIVTHEMGFAAHVADRIAFIDGGRIVDDGPPRQVFHESGSRACGSSCRPTTTGIVFEGTLRRAAANRVARSGAGHHECSTTSA